MRGILFGALALIAVLVGGTMVFVFREAGLTYHAAVDRCHDAGGAWLPSGERSYAGTCLRAPRESPAAGIVRPGAAGP